MLQPPSAASKIGPIWTHYLYRYILRPFNLLVEPNPILAHLNAKTSKRAV